MADETEDPSEDYPQGASNAAVKQEWQLTKSIHDPRMPIRRKIQIRLDSLRKEVKELEDALTALDANPEFEKLHDVLTRVSRFL